jgi:hypothetical protein
LLRPTRYETDHDWDNFAEGRAIEIRVVFKGDSGSASAGRPRRLAREAGACPASPIFGHASPIMDRRLAAARECRSDGLHTIPFPRQSREPHGRSKPMSKRFFCHFGE